MYYSKILTVELWYQVLIQNVFDEEVNEVILKEKFNSINTGYNTSVTGCGSQQRHVVVTQVA